MKRICVAMSVLITGFFVVTDSDVSSVSASTQDLQGVIGNRLATGDNHTCALLADGVVKCWGDNTYGQLGVPNVELSLTPIEVSTFGSNRYATAIAAGKNHTCALLNDASVSCWGDNGFGELGNSKTGVSFLPTSVIAGANPITNVFAGGNNSCAIDSEGISYCWGKNASRQVGDNSTTTRRVPSAVFTPNNHQIMTAIENGSNHSCGLSSLGQIICWGSNSNSQMGTGTSDSELTPVLISTLGNNTSALKVSAGGLHSCAITNNRQVKCWGANSSGQVGDGTMTMRPSPTAVDLSLVDISAGNAHTCGILVDGSAKCWGSNSDGQLGTSASMPSASSPVAVSLPGNTYVKQISAGFKHTCVLTDGEDVLCWGNNDSGQLGNDTTDAKSVPTKVIGLQPSAAVGSVGSSVITDNSATVTSTFNHTDSVTHRTLTYGTDEQMAQDTEQIDLGHFGPIQMVATGSHHSCFVLIDGHVKCWGRNDHGGVGDATTEDKSTPVDVLGLLAPARVVAVGTGHSCAVLANGELWCWGDNSSGQLGNSTSISTSQPTQGDVDDVIDVVAGDDFTCALHVDGQLSCWGSNSQNQLARAGGATPSPEAVTIDDTYTVTSVSAHAKSICAVLSNSTVKCWGNGVSTPTSPGTLSATAANVSVGEQHACAALHTGDVECWGNDTLGQLGNASVTNDNSIVSVELPEGFHASKTVSSGNTTCALSSLRKVMCWGDNTYGVVAPLSETVSFAVPQHLAQLDIPTISQMSIGSLHGCAVSTQGSLWCWGSNNRQQRGIAGQDMIAPTVAVSHVDASVSIELFGLEDDTTYYFQLFTQQHGVTTQSTVEWFNTLVTPEAPLPDEPVVNPDLPVVDSPVVNPPLESPTQVQTPATNNSAPSLSADTSGLVSESVKKVATPMVKVGSWTRATKVLRMLNQPVPRATSKTKVWLTVLNKRVCRLYNGQLWAIRSGSCRLMVLKMGPNRKLTMTPMKVRVGK